MPDHDTNTNTNSNSNKDDKVQQQHTQRHERVNDISDGQTGGYNSDDASLIQHAEELYRSERLLVAADKLRRVQDVSLLNGHHLMMLRWADAVKSGMEDLLTDPFKQEVAPAAAAAAATPTAETTETESTDDADNAASSSRPKSKSKAQQPTSYWKKQSETHGHRDFVVFYHLTKDNLLISRIECPIESSLLVPVIAVFNESQLYSTWMPSFQRPIKLGISQTNKLKETGRGNQIIQVRVALAWPFADRELIMHVVAVDCIEEYNCIAIHAKSESSNDDDSGVIPPTPPNVVAIDYACSILIRPCPLDHPCLERSKHEYPQDESLVLFSLKMTADPHVNAVPQSLQNFVTRTVIGRFWSSLLEVAEDVRDGRRPQHKQAIDSKRELYDWIDGRVDTMLDNIKKEQRQQETTTAAAAATTEKQE